MNLNKNFYNINNYINNYKLATSFHTTCYINAMNNNDLMENMSWIIYKQACLDYFVEKHVKQILLELNNDLGDSSLSLEQIEDIIYNNIKDAIKSGEMNLFDKSDILEIAKLIPEGLLDNILEEGISELLNDPECQEELSQFNSREELEEYVLCTWIKDFLKSEFTSESL